MTALDHPPHEVMQEPTAPVSSDAGPARDLLGVVRAVAVVLFVLSQARSLIPTVDVSQAQPFDGLLKSGNLALTALFVCTGYAVASRMLRALDSGGRRAAVVVFLKHLAVTWAVVLLVVAVVAVVHAGDRTDLMPGSLTWTNLWRTAVLDLNDYIRERPLGVRPDLLSVWYFSIETQLAAGVALLVLLLGRRPRPLCAVLVLAVAAGAVWRWFVYDDQGWFVAGLRTDAWAYAVLLGACVAVLVRLIRSDPATASAVSGGALLLCGGLVVAASTASIGDFYEVQGLLLAGAVALVLGGAALGDGRGQVQALAELPGVGELGRSWQAGVAFSSVVTATLVRHSLAWSAGSRILIGLVSWAVVVYVVDQVVRPGLPVAAAWVRHRLRRPRWRAPRSS